MASGGNFLEVEAGVINLENAESIQEDLSFGNDEYVFSICKESTAGCAVGDRTIAEEMHVGWDLGWRRRGIRMRLQERMRDRHFAWIFGRGRRSNRAERIPAVALVHGSASCFPPVGVWSGVFGGEQSVVILRHHSAACGY